jgi:glucose-6-phosphate isomerase, archaeal
MMSPTLDFHTGQLQGSPLVTKDVRLRDLNHVFLHESARLEMDPETMVYQVQVFQAISEETEGGLFWGTTTVHPGMVGDEYFMTRGHYHTKLNRSEFYLTLRGEGALLLMSADRQVRSEPMHAGTLHYIPGETAHRVANTGAEQLIFTACWPSDAGHDYESIARDGFSACMRQSMGRPVLIRDPQS